MADYTITLKSGEKFTVNNAPEGATDEQVINFIKQNHQQADQTTRTERFGMGLMDPIYGAAQLGARLPSDTPDLPVPPIPEDIRQQRQELVDKAVREREAAYQQRRGPDAGIDWMRGFGSIPTTLALTSPLMAVGGPVAGGVALGAGGGAVQPVTGKDFAGEKAEQIAWGGGTGGILGLFGKAVSGSVRNLGAWFTREYPDNVLTQAVQRIVKRMNQDVNAGHGVTAQGMLDLINEAERLGKPMAPVDVLGPNVRGLAGSVTRKQGEAKTFATKALDERNVGAPARLESDLAQFVHSDQSMLKTVEGLQQARSAEAAGPYARALDPARVVDSDYIRQVLGDPLVRGSIKEGLEAQRIEALATRQPFAGADAAQYLVMDEAGNITGVKGVPNMQILDAVKKGLDRLIEKERNEVTGKLSSRGVGYDKLRREFLSEVDALNPDYAQARAIWSGHSASLDALKAGRAALSDSPEEISTAFNALSQGDQEFYRLGVADKLRERLMKAQLTGAETQQRNAANALLNSDWMKAQLRPIFRSPQEFNDFVAAVNAEHRMFATRSEMKLGSATAGRLAEDQAERGLIEQHGAAFAHELAGGTRGLLSAGMRLVEIFRDRVKYQGLLRNEKVNSEVAKILFSGGPVDPMVERMLLGGAGPREANPLRIPAAVLDKASRALTPGGAGALAGEQSPLGP